MIVRCCQSVLLMMAVALSAGCNVSLQSSQYTFVKNLLKDEPPVVEKNWQVAWDGRVYPVYAVNHDDGIYFANESGLLVSFDGSQVTSLSLPSSLNKKTAQIIRVVLDNGDISLQFLNRVGRSMGRHRCTAWQSATSQDGTKGWDQRCADGSSMYTNEIRTNEQNQVVALKQVLMPGVGPIVIAQRL